MDYEGYHTEYGLHSNIPKCCVKFWNEEFVTLIMNDSGRHRAYNAAQDAAELQMRKSFQYRPCWNCMLTQNWQKIHTCKGVCKDLFRRLKVKYGIEGAPAVWRREYVKPQ